MNQNAYKILQRLHIVTIICTFSLMTIAREQCSAFVQGHEATYPDQVTENGLAALSGDKTEVNGLLRAMIVIPLESSLPQKIETRKHLVASQHLQVYIREGQVYIKRFEIHLVDAELTPIGKRIGQFLALIWCEANKHFGSESPALRHGVAHVWLTRQGEAGGEQIANQIYIYDVTGMRTDMEWAREITHEFGHYILPGASGYTDPESWSNGIFGERLFLHWLRESVINKQIDEKQLQFVTLDMLDEFELKQTGALLNRFRRTGPDHTLLGQNSKASLNSFTGLMISISETYGAPTIYRLLEFLRGIPSEAKGTTFLEAFELWAGNQPVLNVSVPREGAKLYFPTGRFLLSGCEEKDIQLLASTASVTLKSKLLTVSKPGWYTLTNATNHNLNLRFNRQ